MDVIQELFSSLRRDEASQTVLEIWRDIALKSPASGLIQRGLPEVHREQLYAFDRLGYWPRVKNPRSFNEKLLHRKLFTDIPIFTDLADKFRVRTYVKERVGDDILNDLYHVTDDPSTIPFETLPEQFVIKSTHSWNQVILVENKAEADFETIRSKCRDFLSEQYGQATHEYWYTRIDPQIIVEKYIQDGTHDAPRDFKFSVFHGSVELIEVHFDRFSNHTARFYEPDWVALDIRQGDPLGPDIDEPPLLDEMIEIAETLGNGFDFVRVDLYQPNGDEIVFGEMTMAPTAGYTPFEPEECDFILGSYW